MPVQPGGALHLTNGDAALYLLKKAGIAGVHLAWHDSLNVGPVPAGLTLEETSSIRTRYLAARGYDNPIKLIHDFERRDAQLRRAGEFEEVVLWFEHDLFDQLQLLQILTALDELRLHPGHVAVVQTDHYLSGVTLDEMLALLPKRRTATEAIFRSGRRSWERFVSPTPDGLLAAAGEDAIGLPYLRAALRRMCEEYPSTRDGLSRSQRQALYAIAQGPATDDELFTRSQAREEATFMSKRAFAMLLDDLRAGEGALFEGEGPTVTLTALGRRVLAGDADWLAEHAIDRWIGGVHLVPGSIIRWDDEAARFV
ncbi:MAG TPA: DUF1835 domain-containing protein [Candidatus Cybelea sp.]|jgi:hypothetical protein|nr:DUF1835 domain-containing protein [Candidatus Cybelea sp.]